QLTPIGLRREHNIFDGRVHASRPIITVVEDKDVPRARQSFGNPMRVVLSKQTLILRRSGAIDARVTPAIKHVAALAAPSASSSSCLFRRCAVVDDPNFAE